MLLPSQINVNKIHHFSGHAAGVFALEAGSSQHTILSGGGEGLVVEWDLNAVHPGLGIVRVSGNIFALLYVPQHDLLIAGDLKGDVHITDIIQKKEISAFSCDGAIVYDIKAIDSDHIGIGCENGFFYIWNILHNKLVKKIHVADKSIRSIIVSKERQEIIFSCSDNFIYVYDLPSLKHKHVLGAHGSSVFCAMFNKEQTVLITGSRDAALAVWDAANDYSLIKKIPAHMFTINDLKLSPDGRLFASAGRDKHIKIWDANSYTLLKVIDHEKFGGHINSVNKLFWSNWNNYLISCGDDRAVMVWDITTTK